MKSKSKNGWCSIMSLRLQGKSATRFCCPSPGTSPVYLNVYDLTPVNGYCYWAGIGVFHTGVEVHGVEYAFGAHDYSTSGVFEVKPRKCPGYKFRKSIYMGTTFLDPKQVREFMEHHSANYNGDSYHLIVKNCNHFCDDMSSKLTGKRIPKWVNRLAKIGSMCNCILPEGLKYYSDEEDEEEEEYYEYYDDNASEKKRLRKRSSSFNWLSSMSTNQKESREVSMSSLFLHAHYKGCLPPWELKKSKNDSRSSFKKKK